MRSYIGIDFGGTKLLIGLVGEDGSMIAVNRYDTGYVSQEQAVGIITNAVKDFTSTELKECQKPEAIGIGVIGRVDPKTGIWHQIDKDRNTSVELCGKVAELTGLPCFADNDVKSAAKSELIWGIGKETDNFTFINIGTGIAAGSFVGGRLVRGGNSNAGEVGHTTSGINLGFRCCCGRLDCVELIASGSGISRCAYFLHDRYETSLELPSDGSPVKVQDVVELYGKGDKLCEVLVENATTAAANLIMDQIRAFDPEAVVLGGGVISNDIIFGKVMDKIDAHTSRFVTKGIKRTTLDSRYAGLLGAAANCIVR